MTLESGGWGLGRWDSMVWGFSTFGLAFSGNIVSQALLDTVTQAKPLGQRVSVSVFIDNVDVSSIVESVSVKNTSPSAAKTATIVFIGSTVPGLVLRNSIVDIFFSYIVDGSTFSASIFSGKARTQKLNPDTKNAFVEVSLFDLSRDIDEATIQNTAVSGSAVAFILSELAFLGFNVSSIEMSDFTTLYPPTSWGGSVRRGIDGMIRGRGILVFDGSQFRIVNPNTSVASSWSIPLAGQFSREETDDGKQYNRVTAINSTGITQTYYDTAHIAINGVSPLVVWAPFCLTAAELLVLAENTSKASMGQRYSLEIPVIPFFGAGDAVNIETDAGYILVRCEESEIAFSWPSGPSQKIKAQEYA